MTGCPCSKHDSVERSFGCSSLTEEYQTAFECRKSTARSEKAASNEKRQQKCSRKQQLAQQIREGPSRPKEAGGGRRSERTPLGGGESRLRKSRREGRRRRRRGAGLRGQGGQLFVGHDGGQRLPGWGPSSRRFAARAARRPASRCCRLAQDVC